MKQLLLFVLSLFLLLPLCGCSQDIAMIPGSSSEQVPAVETTSETPAKSINTITCAALTDREELLASAIGDTYIFDYNVDGKFQYIRLWMKVYTFGNEVKDQYANMMDEINTSGTMIFSLSEPSEEEPGRIMFCAGSRSSTSGGSKSETIDVPYIQNNSEYGEAFGISNVTLPSSAETALAYVRSYSGDINNSLSDMFLNDYKNQLNQIANDDLVYIFGCTFYTNKS